MDPPHPPPHTERTIQGGKTSRWHKPHRQLPPGEFGLGIYYIDVGNSSNSPSRSQAAPKPRALSRLQDAPSQSNRWSTAVEPDISRDGDLSRYNKSPMFGSKFNPHWPANTRAAGPPNPRTGDLQLNEGIMSASAAPPHDKAASTPEKKRTNEKSAPTSEAQSLVAVEPPLNLATANLEQLASRPLPSGTPINLDSFIDDLLEKNYREQATTFAQNASNRSTSRSTKAATLRSASLSKPSPSPSPSPSTSISQNSVDGQASPSQVLSPSGSFYTPTRTGPLNRIARRVSLAARQRNLSTPQRQVRVASQSFSTPTGEVVLETYGQSPSGRGASPHATYGHKFTRVPSTPGAPSANKHRRSTGNSEDIIRGPLYFTNEERQGHIALVSAVEPSCKNHHANCTDCRDIKFAYYENKTMSTAIPAEERQKIINNNRSLRNIKNELENLAEHGAISDEVYDKIMRSLPQESSLNASSARSNPTPSPAPVPTNAFANMNVNNEPPPPAYNTPTTGPPSLPNRGRPEIARATALYRYAEPEDCNFEVGDEISVFEKMNADWWLGKNVRTGKEGVFPVNYVQVQTNPEPLPSPAAYGNEKAGGYPGAYQAQQQGPPPPGPSNPYNSSVPPMAVAEQPTDGKPSKGGEMGKKFGKKLGNAAIFGAGATIGGNIVNSIF